MIEWFQKGGPVMWPILACSIFALAIFLERLFALKRSKIIPDDFLKGVEDLLRHNKTSEAQALCQQSSSKVATVLEMGIKNQGKTRARIKESIEEVGKRESQELSRYVGALATIAHISPLLGLLGTVTGMMRVFQVITEKGVGNAQSLAGGISEALITTIAGLIVAIPTVVAFRFLNARVKELITEMEDHSLRMMEFLIKGD